MAASPDELVASLLYGAGLRLFEAHFKGPCRLRDRAGDGNTLLFEIEFDQTDIPAMLEKMRKIESDFPVVGLGAG